MHVTLMTMFLTTSLTSIAPRAPPSAPASCGTLMSVASDADTMEKPYSTRRRLRKGASASALSPTLSSPLSRLQRVRCASDAQGLQPPCKLTSLQSLQSLQSLHTYESIQRRAYLSSVRTASSAGGPLLALLFFLNTALVR